MATQVRKKSINLNKGMERIFVDILYMKKEMGKNICKNFAGSKKGVTFAA